MLDKPGYGKPLSQFDMALITPVPVTLQYGVKWIIPPDVKIGLVSGFHRALIMKNLHEEKTDNFSWIPLYLFHESVTSQVNI